VVFIFFFHSPSIVLHVSSSPLIWLFQSQFLPMSCVHIIDLMCVCVCVYFAVKNEWSISADLWNDSRHISPINLLDIIPPIHQTLVSLVHSIHITLWFDSHSHHSSIGRVHSRRVSTTRQHRNLLLCLRFFRLVLHFLFLLLCLGLRVMQPITTKSLLKQREIISRRRISILSFLQDLGREGIAGVAAKGVKWPWLVIEQNGNKWQQQWQKNQKSKIKNQKSKIKNQKSKIKNQKSKNQKSKIKTWWKEGCLRGQWTSR